MVDIRNNSKGSEGSSAKEHILQKKDCLLGWVKKVGQALTEKPTV